MNPEPAIVVNDLHKEFILPQHKHVSIKQSFVNFTQRNEKVTQKVLDGVSFTVNKGDFFGIVGRNGSGKSTLLKILAGVYVPTTGTVEMYGKLTPFIELGVGFNPELSGRDNIFLNGALLGFTRKEMEGMYQEIVDFAELEPFMDQKLKNYSSGMQVRLAFSIAIKAKNDILIFDEVLAVGDEAFQRKCLDVFEGYKAQKQTVILVTHDMETVRQYCNRAILINEGKIIEEGNPRKVANHYSKLNQDSTDAGVASKNDAKDQLQPSKLKVSILNENDEKAVSFNVNDRMKVRLSWPELQGVKSVGVNIFKESGEHVTGANTRKDHIKLDDSDSIDLTFSLPIQPGKYYVLVEAFRNEGELLDSKEDDAPRFTVKKSEVSWSGLVELPHQWQG